MTPGERPTVAVFLGTDHHRFDRLLRWVGELQSRTDLRFQVQHGYTPLPEGLAGEAMLDCAALDELLRRASAVVTHAGPGSIMDARSHGHVPVVVPRDPRLGEHVDDHQLRFARFLERTEMVATAHDAAQLEARLRSAALAGPRQLTGAASSATVARFEQLVEGLVRR